MIIIFAGYEITKEVFSGTQSSLNNSWLNIFGMSLVILITYGFSRYEAKIGKETESPGLTADSKHILVDYNGLRKLDNKTA